MILKALCELAEDRHLSEDLDFENKDVRFHIILSEDGTGSLVDRASFESVQLGKKTKTVLTVPSGRVPRQEKRSGQLPPPNFLVDKADYVFGCNPGVTGDKAARLPGWSESFKKQVSDLFETLEPGSSEYRAVAALLRFLERPSEERADPFLRMYGEATSEGERKSLSAAQFAFEYEPASPTPIHLMPAVVEYWRKARIDSAHESADILCLVTGQRGAAAEKHQNVKPVPGGNPVGTTLVGFNEPAFWSYGLNRNENAPISQRTADSYVNALNWLLGKGPTKQNLRVSSDSVVVFWAKDGCDDWVSLGFDSDSPESVRHVLQTPQSGRRAAIDNPSAFFSIILSGAQGRCVVRSFFETTTADAARAMLRYLDDTAIEKPYGKGVGNLPLKHLVESLGVEGRGETVVAADLTTRLYLAALRGLPFPNTVLSSAVHRNKAEAAVDEKKNRFKWSRFAARAALVRAVLRRNEGMEVNVTLDRQNSEPAYLLGRLFATLDRIQQDALGKVNASTAERYYGAASSTPASVFPTLLRRNQHHLSKLSKDKPGFAVNREKVLAEIMGGLQGFKRTMTLPEQGLFALGFHHQRQDFFTKKED